MIDIYYRPLRERSVDHCSRRWPSREIQYNLVLTRWSVDVKDEQEGSVPRADEGIDDGGVVASHHFATRYHLAIEGDVDLHLVEAYVVVKRCVLTVKLLV